MLSNARPCFQLYAEGSSINGWKFRMRSKAIFTDRAEAEGYAAQFRELCLDETFFEHAMADRPLEIRVVELELVG